jgi:uncharacterized OB-fold protein
VEAPAFTGQSFYDHLGEQKLTGSKCESCGTLYIPPRPMCGNCFGEDMAPQEMSGTGKLIAFTTVHIAPTAMIEAGFDRNNPYCAGIVRLAEGPAISGQVLGVDPTMPDQIEIGMSVQATFIERSAGDRTGVFLAFAPAD